MAEHRYEDAVAIYDAMIATSGATDAISYPRFYKAVARFAEGRRDEARALLMQVRPGPFMAPEALLYLGHCEAIEDHADAAIQWYRQIDHEYPASYAMPCGLYHGAQVLKRVGRTAEATAMLAELKQRFPLSIYASKPPPEYEYHVEANPSSVAMPGMFGL
jgi:tetratricopeptide (TPR) repeat protein